MKNKIKTLVAITVIALTTSFGCKKGDTGPAGTNGTNGVANISSSTFMNQGLSYVSANNDYEVTLNDAAITQTVVDNGAVMIYTQASSNPSGWVVLPATIGGVSLNIAFGVGQALVSSPNPSSGNLNFRVVVIPPASRKANPNVNYKNYEEVKKTFNLKD